MSAYKYRLISMDSPQPDAKSVHMSLAYRCVRRILVPLYGLFGKGPPNWYLDWMFWEMSQKKRWY